MSLVEDDELVWMQTPELVSQAEALGVAVVRHPVVDGDTPEPSAARRTVQAAVTLARSGRTVVFHCRGGLGRAGTFAAMALQHLGMEADASMATVRSVRPGAIENRRQERFVTAGWRIG